MDNLNLLLVIPDLGSVQTLGLVGDQRLFRLFFMDKGVWSELANFLCRNKFIWKEPVIPQGFFCHIDGTLELRNFGYNIRMGLCCFILAWKAARDNPTSLLHILKILRLFLMHFVQLLFLHFKFFYIKSRNSAETLTVHGIFVSNLSRLLGSSDRAINLQVSDHGRIHK